MSESEETDQLLRLADVKRRVGLGKTMIYHLIGEGRFPKPCKITPFAARWSELEIKDWIERTKRQRSP